tara:strand:+ start:519 stop:998 length:480 start_codon:yes stop_codon:yes gene_type:complete
MFAKKSKNIEKTLGVFIEGAKKEAELNLVRNKSVDQGDLRQSLSTKKKITPKKGGEWKLVVNSVHGAFVEFGTRKRANPPSSLSSYASTFRGMKGEGGNPIKKLTDYFTSKGFDEDGIGIAIMDVLKNGTKPHPFFFPAIWKKQAKLFKDLRREMRKKK